MNQKNRIEEVIHLLIQETQHLVKPAASEITRLFGRDAFLILISTILSLRTKDTVSLPASIRLFKLAQTPDAVVELDSSIIEEAIYPVGFYRQKAKTIHVICKKLLSEFNGQVPADKEKLMSLPGVGLKTANLVLSEGFLIPALCVDVHVHRISNRLGLVKTKTPEETEAALQKIIPQNYWIRFNELLVMWGQNQCVPVSPFCSTCPLQNICPKNDVKKNR